MCYFTPSEKSTLSCGGELRYFFARQFCRFYALLSVKFVDFKMRSCKKYDKYMVWKLVQKCQNFHLFEYVLLCRKFHLLREVVFEQVGSGWKWV